MSKEIAFYFDFGSPNSYLAYARLPALAARTGATIEYRPILLGGVFKATGNTSPAMLPVKARYLLVDMARCAARHDTPFVFNPHFPVNSMAAMRAATALLGSGTFAPFTDAAFRAMWVEERDLSDPAVLSSVAAAAGAAPDALAEAIESPVVKAALREATEGAVARGVFGAPTFFVGSEMFFGQDRLDFVEAALA